MWAHQGIPENRICARTSFWAKTCFCVRGLSRRQGKNGADCRRQRRNGRLIEDFTGECDSQERRKAVLLSCLQQGSLVPGSLGPPEEPCEMHLKTAHQGKKGEGLSTNFCGFACKMLTLPSSSWRFVGTKWVPEASRFASTERRWLGR